MLIRVNRTRVNRTNYMKRKTKIRGASNNAFEQKLCYNKRISTTAEIDIESNNCFVLITLRHLSRIVQLYIGDNKQRKCG